MVRLGILFYGRSKIEKMLNIMIYISFVLALLSVGLALIEDIVPKFYSAVIFSFAFVGALIFLRMRYIESEPKYETLRQDYIESGASKDTVDEYIKNLREWEVFTDWLKLVIGFMILLLAVYLFIP